MSLTHWFIIHLAFPNHSFLSCENQNVKRNFPLLTYVLMNIWWFINSQDEKDDKDGMEKCRSETWPHIFRWTFRRELCGIFSFVLLQSDSYLHREWNAIGAAMEATVTHRRIHFSSFSLKESRHRWHNSDNLVFFHCSTRKQQLLMLINAPLFCNTMLRR